MDEKEHEKKEFQEQAIKEEERKLKARSNKEITAWWGLGLFGMVGWSVMLPTLLGIFVGLFLDHKYDHQSHTYTLLGLLAGICLGSTIAFVSLGMEMFKREDK